MDVKGLSRPKLDSGHGAEDSTMDRTNAFRNSLPEAFSKQPPRHASDTYGNKRGEVAGLWRPFASWASVEGTSRRRVPRREAGHGPPGSNVWRGLGGEAGPGASGRGSSRLEREIQQKKPAALLTGEAKHQPWLRRHVIRKGRLAGDSPSRFKFKPWGQAHYFRGPLRRCRGRGRRTPLASEWRIVGPPPRAPLA